MSLLGIVAVLILLGLIFWATKAIGGVFGVPEQVVVVVQVILVILAVLYLVQVLGGIGGAPILRLL